MAETQSKSNEDHLKWLDKEVTNLRVALKSLGQMLKVLSTKHDRLEEMIGEMNQKYESIIIMLAQMNRVKLILRKNKSKEVQCHFKSVVIKIVGVSTIQVIPMEVESLKCIPITQNSFPLFWKR